MLDDHARIDETTDSEAIEKGLAGKTRRPSRHGRSQSVGRWIWEWAKSIFIALILWIAISMFGGPPMSGAAGVG